MTLTDPGRVCSFGSGVKRSCLSPAMTTMCSGPPNLKAINTLSMCDSGSQQPTVWIFEISLLNARPLV